ncbi:MAG: hypothetical protein LC623_05735 [Halobacteriales archaeon]|nr:hypothetical protein [Halobacteriales archaeon]
MADPKALRYPREVECDNCGRPTMVPGPPPHPNAKVLCGLCLELSVHHLAPLEKARIMRELAAISKRVQAMTLEELCALHRDDGKVTPSTLGDALLMSYRGFYGMGRLLTLMNEHGIPLPIQPPPGATP